MKKNELVELLNSLVNEPHEQEWLEFKHNFHSIDEIGETISALANGACLHQKPFGYLVFGVEDVSHKILGTTFKAKTHKKNSEDLEPWLATRLNPRIDFIVEEFEHSPGVLISLFKIPAAIDRPISFLHTEYIRVGKTNRKLADFPEKAAKIWRNHQNLSWEKGIAKSNLTPAEVVELLSTQTYFELLKLPYPSTQQGVMDKFLAEKFINKTSIGYDITRLGAILLAKNLNDFDELARKATRVIVYKGNNKLETEREQIGAKGYAVGFEGLIDWINGQLPANEEIGKALRVEHRMYPALATRELIANALIHQDFFEKGFPTIEIYKDRLEISNPGIPLIKPERFFDEYNSRNEKLADCMRRMRFCEEKGSGMDKVIFQNELFQLPAINIVMTDTKTIVTLYSYKPLNQLDKKDKIRACYQHACLKYLSGEKMSNQSLRERFKIEERNAAIASRIINDTVDVELIKEDDPNSGSRKFKKYIPFWA